jgi:hypothetical protein
MKESVPVKEVRRPKATAPEEAMEGFSRANALSQHFEHSNPLRCPGLTKVMLKRSARWKVQTLPQLMIVRN